MSATIINIANARTAPPTHQPPMLTSVISSINGIATARFVEPGRRGGVRQWTLDQPDALGLVSLTYEADGDLYVIVCHHEAISVLRRMLDFAGNRGRS